MRTVILCCGKGTRAHPHTVEVPKPLLPVGDQPVLAHVMSIYARQGFTDFVLAAGYRCELIREFARTVPPEWSVEVLDTGPDTNTGERVRRCRDHVDGTFFVTYADGLGDVDLRSLLDAHAGHDGVATLTTVALPSPYGTVETDASGCVVRFREKPRLAEHRINAGYFVFDDAVFDHWRGEDLERDVLPALASAGELFVHPHDGFWRSLDTHKDSLELSELCDPGPPPWEDR